MVDNPASRIVFETDRDGNSEIYSMEPNGNDGITRLTNSPAVADTGPSLSPDGSLIAWDRGGRIWLMNSDGTEQHALTSSGDGRDGAPAFSPDGTKIAFHSNREGTDDIWVMNVDGSAQTNLTDTEGNDLGPTWSPDGTKLAFDSDRDGDRDIFTMNSDDGGELGNLTSDSPSLDADPDWSPDGEKILFVSGRGDTTSVWTMNVDGTAAEQHHGRAHLRRRPGVVADRRSHRLHTRQRRADVQPAPVPRRRHAAFRADHVRQHDRAQLLPRLGR